MDKSLALKTYPAGRIDENYGAGFGEAWQGAGRLSPGARRGARPLVDLVDPLKAPSAFATLRCHRVWLFRAATLSACVDQALAVAPTPRWSRRAAVAGPGRR